MPAATMLEQALAAVVKYVLFGSGALAAFWSSAEQHFAKLCAGAPPVGFFTVSAAEAEGTTSGTNSTGAVGVGAATGVVAEGRGGGGSSFLQPR